MEAINQIKEKIETQRSYVLEAGAGSGKTYALIQTINYILELKGKSLQLKNQKIVCITYTNVAKNEIIERLENNPLVLVSTIHEFLWDCIKSYNKQLIIEFDAINTIYHETKPDKYSLMLIERIITVEYNDRAYSDFENGKVGHDDLINLANRMFSNHNLLTTILASKHPYILVDEYQDTAPETIYSLLDFLLPRNKEKIVIGFYGDSHQKIYNTGIGSLHAYVDAKTIDIITKLENYRSSQSVIGLLNNVRTNIKQVIPDDIKKIEGSIQFINCTNYPDKTTGQKVKEYEDSLVPIKNANYDTLITELEKKGWNFGPESEDKILIIANSRVAKRGGFGNLYSIYSRRYGLGGNDALLKRENPITAFFVGSMDKKTSNERRTGIEHLVSFFEENSYSDIVNLLKRNGTQSINLKKHPDKKVITDKIEELITIRKSKTVKDVFDFAIDNKLAMLSTGVIKFLDRINTPLDSIEDELKIRIEKDIIFHNALMAMPYSEFINLFKHTQNQNVFSTKHGTKGEEYRNVLVVIDDTSWKGQYNFENYFNDTDDNIDRKERTKNLFYVSCSRAKENLVVLALSKMGNEAMSTIQNWFGKNNIK
ncbi:ATP-dependent helicase [Cellulophaga baltica]|uniref:UvrD-helicase domain-containing protein n=1 Tax=Cellulophaga TaxID=104264 RepID=UPI001C07ABD3|nr:MULTISPECIES: ATP-dependent helicase [Cellulophaga]MBU2998132.1 ATP-dependent helicase [Cellulophaga baltica]MDO6769537.1 ATP-dependent helicase [Cellulophaga sp. 1_MG-2023]